MNRIPVKSSRLRLAPKLYEDLRQRGVTPGRMEVPELRRDVESRGSSSRIA